MNDAQWYRKRIADLEQLVRLFTAPPSVTVIDADEFEAAKNDPAWRRFCEEADAYYAYAQKRAGENPDPPAFERMGS